MNQPVQTAIAQVGRSLGQYLLSLVLTDALLGLAVWGTFRLFGVHYAAAWGLAAAVLHFMPLIGPTALAIGSFTLVAIQFHSLARALLLGALTIVLAGSIGVVLQLWLSGRGARMNVAATFASAVFWVWVWGLPGLVFGTPITIVFKAICAQIPSLRWLDSLMSERPRNGASGHGIALTGVNQGDSEATLGGHRVSLSGSNTRRNSP
jgi:predicted PurR-regulated permease PerM